MGSGSGLEFTRQPWEEHIKQLRWKQGEHVLIAAPTSAGKTTLAQKIAHKRRHVAMFVTKPEDPTFTREFKGQGWKRINSWPPDRYDEKVMLWPRSRPAKLTDRIARDRELFGDALDDIGNGRGWCVWLDELHYLSSNEFARLGGEIALLHHQGRSSGISLLSLTQRPAWVPKIIYSSVTHAYIARTRDTGDLKRLADLGGVDPKRVAEAVANLEKRHDYLYVNPQGDGVPRIVNTAM